MLVVFTSDQSATRSGFLVSYSSCTLLTSAIGSISSPNYPNNYNNLDSVCWFLNPQSGSIVTLSFNTFETESHLDFVRVFDGPFMNSSQLLSASGNAPSSVTSSSNAILIVFSSDSNNVYSGFQATFISCLKIHVKHNRQNYHLNRFLPTVPDSNILTSRNDSFASPDYPNKYDNNLMVGWLINGQDYVSISFPGFNTEYQRDFVRVYDGNSTSAPLLLEDSGSNSTSGYYKRSVVSSTNQMLVVFTTDSEGTGAGFQATYSSCTVLNSATGSISSPNYPNNYTDLDNVCWVINPPVGAVSLSFNRFHTENSDVVRVFDGNSTNSRQLLSASGDTVPSAVISSSNIMLVVFSSDFSSVAQGFHATFTSSKHPTV